MEQITITIDTINDAFDGGYERSEIARILRVLADSIDSDRNPASLYDINGNKVGRVSYN